MAGVAVTRSVVKRDGRRVDFDASRIRHAIEMAFRAEAGCPYPDALHAALDAQVGGVTEAVVGRLGGDAALHIEQIQDEVERELMAGGHYAVARRYILYREARAARREGDRLRVLADGGRMLLLDRSVLRHELAEACAGLVGPSDVDALYQATLGNLYPGIAVRDLEEAKILAARLLLDTVYSEATGLPVRRPELRGAYGEHFQASIRLGVAVGRLDPRLLEFDLARLGAALRPDNDLQFRYLGLQTLYDRYLVHHEGRRLELPQGFWMRVAMGLCLQEPEREQRAIELYEVMSALLYCPSTPTLFNAGTLHPQLSSCFLTTVPDDLHGIFEAVHDNAMLSKWSGGLGNDWTPVRALGAHIRGTNGKSQGVIPFLKVANDTAVAVNQGGKRSGAVCAYLETWHLDIEEFLKLRRNAGDERRRTHDMNTANWVPDLFMQRVAEDGPWTLFSPDEVPDLHDLYGRAFEARYTEYERRADAGEVRTWKRVQATELWRSMLAMLFETGHPWITFKDPSNIRSPQDHVGVVHSSNLCTEILLNTAADPAEIAVCNLGSVNLAAHVGAGGLDLERLRRTVSTGMRMLDNVIDINLYPVAAAERANRRHRPVGLGIMGFQDALHRLGLSYASQEGVTFADRSMEAVSHSALLASADLAAERGPYPSFPGSKWDRGLLPLDTLALLRQERGGVLEVDAGASLDWAVVRAAIAAHGLRNSNCLAIAPTATISNIVGVSQSIEPTYRNLYAKSNLSGEFTAINEYLVADLRRAGLWDAPLIEDLKYYDGSLREIERVPEEIRQRYLTAFEIDPAWLIECASRRQKWIDMGQSLNLYVAEPNGRRISDMYFLAWRRGLKTTYYLRGLAATQVEKSTVDINARALQPRWMTAQSPSAAVTVQREAAAPLAGAPAPGGGSTLADLRLAGAPAPSCSIDDPECEACQ